MRRASSNASRVREAGRFLLSRLERLLAERSVSAAFCKFTGLEAGASTAFSIYRRRERFLAFLLISRPSPSRIYSTPRYSFRDAAQRSVPSLRCLCALFRASRRLKLGHILLARFCGEKRRAQV